MKLYFPKKESKEFKVVCLILILFILEIIACYYSYYTLGEVKQMFLIFLFFLNGIPVVLYFLKTKIISLIIVLTIALFIIPNQVVLLKKWYDLKKEATEINKHIYHYKLLNNQFPENILAYEFKNKKLIKNFSYRNKNGSNFGLHYHIGTEGTTHFYYHNSGKWAYYPD